MKNTENKYVMVKPLYGMGGRLSVFITALEYSRRTGRELIVDWNGGSFGSNKIQFDVFRYFFKSPRITFLTDDSIRRLSSECSVFPEIWRDRLDTKKQSLPRAARYSRPSGSEPEEDIFVITRDSPEIYLEENENRTTELFREIELSDYVQELVDSFRNQNFSDSSIIGVHFRHGNGEEGVKPPSLDWYFAHIDSILEAKEAKIFLCTDCSAILEIFQERYNSVISTTKEYLEVGSGAFHYQEEFEERLQSGIEALLDIWLLSHCDYLVVSDSYFVVPVKYRTEIPADRIFWNEHDRVPSLIPGLEKASDNDRLLKLLGESDINCSGLYFDQKEGDLQIYYLDEYLLNIPSPMHETRKVWDGEKWVGSLDVGEAMDKLNNLLQKVRYF